MLEREKRGGEEKISFHKKMVADGAVRRMAEAYVPSWAINLRSTGSF